PFLHTIPPTTRIHPLSLHDALPISLTDTAAVKQALIDIIAKTVPPTEICNGKDDNCNGLIDEGVSNMCGVSNNPADADNQLGTADRKSTRLNSSHLVISYAVFCLKK